VADESKAKALVFLRSDDTAMFVGDEDEKAEIDTQLTGTQCMQR
jgi:hypothetical protein